ACDYFYLLGKGHIIKEGTKDVVFDDEEVLKANKLNQPWLIKLHQKLGLPLCNNSQELFALRGHIHVDNL
ncbi:MAG: ABC transporter ATP-binding protein, partial [Bombilactobacillus sp.]